MALWHVTAAKSAERRLTAAQLGAYCMAVSLAASIGSQSLNAQSQEVSSCTRNLAMRRNRRIQLRKPQHPLATHPTFIESCHSQREPRPCET
jgi:hypothetical protein